MIMCTVRYIIGMEQSTQSIPIVPTNQLLSSRVGIITLYIECYVECIHTEYV